MPASQGPDSLLWHHFGDSRTALLAQRAGVLQAMHPAIGAALAQHSDYFDDPIDRLRRSAGPILGTVYDADPVATARSVRDLHPPIRGVDHRGRAYQALEPSTWFWAHAVFVESVITTQRLFGPRPLTESEQRRLYAESIEWYARYGVTMRPVPADLDAFRDYWRATVRDVLEPTAAARFGVRRPAPMAWLARGTLPVPARQRLGCAWGPADEAALRALRRTVRTAWPRLPTRLQRLPRALVAELPKALDMLSVHVV